MERSKMSLMSLGHILLILFSAALLFGLPGELLAGPCDPPILNPVACENTKTGNPASEWDISGVGDTSIQGYATDISVNRGETVYFKVDTDAASYRLDIYRMGYYGGLGARKVATVAPSAPLPQSQPACVEDETAGMTDCGNWAVSASWNVPADAVSGIYFAKAVRTDGRASHIVFIVRDDGSTSDLLFQTSDTTWQAYNNYGGNFIEYPDYGYPTDRAFKGSYNRPFWTRRSNDGLSSYNWLFHAEYPMVRWLEANGYNVSYSTGVDSDRRGSLIRNHKVFLSVGHDEYWSGQQRANVEAARNAGVHLAFFSGNEVYRKIRWEASIDGAGTPYRTMVCYKESNAEQKIDPLPNVWTGSWRDARFSPPADGGLPENALTGTLFGVVAAASDALGIPLAVPEANGKMRFWRNTSVAALSPGQTATLGERVVGYEFDEDFDNGFRPAGLIQLSSTPTQAAAKVALDNIYRGQDVYSAGPATHVATLYRAASGALVFSAGSVQWSWGLDGQHDNGATTPNAAMRQATVNLLADMGVQAGSLQPGLVPASASTDSTPPTTAITQPADGAVVSVGSAVTISGTAGDTLGVVAAVEVSVNGGLTWHPASGRTNWSYTWTPGAAGAVTLLSRAVDDSGNIGPNSAAVDVTVGSVAPPGGTSIWNDSYVPSTLTDPDSTARTQGVNLGVKFRSAVDGYITGLRFYKGPNNSGTHTGSLWTRTGTLLASLTFSSETATGWQYQAFAAPVAITANTTYVASYRAPAGNYSASSRYFASTGFDNYPLRALADGEDGGNGLYRYGASAFPNETWNSENYWVDVVFQQNLGPDTTPPTVTAVTPASGAVNVGTATTVTAAFNEAMDPATINAATFELRDSANAVVAAAVSYDGATRTATLDPAAALAAGATYTARVLSGAGGVKDAAGNPLAADFIWIFTTASGGSSNSYSIWDNTAVPAILADTDTSAVELGMKFRSSLAGYITGIKFYKGAGNTGTHVGNLWTSGGTKLGSVTFTGETASGWQVKAFSTPVAVSANTTYVVSYHAPVGRYSANVGYFASGVDSPPLRALSNSESGGNGVYRYGASAFPNQTWNSTNYWVDVVFQETLGSDTTPPTVISVSPTAGAVNVGTGTNVTAIFSEVMDPATISASTFELRDSGSSLVAASVTYNPTSRTATLTPSAALAGGAAYTATIQGGSGGAADAAGNPLAADYTWSFTTAAAPVDTTPPTVTSATPSNGSTNVSTAATVNVTFSEPMNASSINISTFELRNSANALVAAAVSYNTSNTAVLTPVAALTAGETYIARVLGGTGGVADLAGNYLVLTYSWSFTTAAAADATPPTVTLSIPSSGAAGINIDTQVSAVFSEPVNAATVNETTFELRNSANVLVAAAVTYSASTQTAVLTPGSALAYGTSYTATVKGPGGVEDLAGNPMAADFVWSFTTAAAPGDSTPPTISAVYPFGGSTGVGTGTSVRVTFSEAMNASSITSSTFVLHDSSNSQVPAAIVYSSATRTAILDPGAALEAGKNYTATVVGGAGGVADLAGNRLTESFSWSFSTSSSSPYGSGPGGPVLVITSAANPFSRYLAEILTAEGLNAFAVRDISTVTATVLASYDVVVLGQTALTSSQVTMFSSWVTAGGNLIAMRPDKQLAGLLGLTDSGTTLSEGYLLVSTAAGPGKGIVGQTIQFHGTADRYTLNGATSVATLYSSPTAATTSPAVSLRSVGTNGGQAAAFTYDLASSIVMMRQGNAAWAGQERDGYSPTRSDDLFYPDWVNLNKAAIPQADEQQRLLANLIIQMNFDKKPLPRFWYFPDGLEAAVVMTGDDHGYDGTAGRFNQYIAASPAGCSVDDWECIRSTSYLYPDPDGAVTDAQASAYNAAGFEIGLHVNTGCADYTREQLEDYFAEQMADFRALYPSLPPTVSHRAHCIAWSGYTTMAEVEADYGIRMDVNYYYWPGDWVADRPGFFTGSGMPMRFATAAGEIIDVYQTATQMTDESGQTYPYTIDMLLDRAIGTEGYYGAFVANIHTDSVGSPYSDAIVNSALSRGIPIISARQLLKWVDGRNGSSFGSFSSTSSTLGFSISVGQGAIGLEAMVPKPAGKSIAGIQRDGQSVGYVSKVVKGLDYAVFPAIAGNYVVTFSADSQPPTVFSTLPIEGAVNVAASTDVRATFSEAMDPATISGSNFTLQAAGGAVVPAVVTYDSATNTAVLTPTTALAAGTAYTATVLGGSGGVKDAAGNALATNYSWSFTTVAGGGGSQAYSIWDGATIPSVPSANDANAVELGVKFRSSVSGYIMGIKFYKGTGNTGAHAGSLWTSTGSKLAGVTFAGETATGWQYQAFAAPVAISANTTYVASYHAPVGRYAADSGYFNAAVDRPPLRALASGEDGGNGVYRYGSSGFPTGTWNAANYWVDVVFQESLGPDATAPTITSVSPALGAANVAITANVTAVFSEAMDASTIDVSTFLLRDSTNAVVEAAVTYDSATRTATLDPTAALRAGETYTAQVLGGDLGVADLAGNPLASDRTWSFTTTSAVSQSYSFWDDADTPAVLADSDTNAVELGMKFRSSVPGSIVGIRFYKSSANTGTHVGNLWTRTGTRLATVTFTNETGSGWQYQAFSAPVAISANTTYVVSYHAPVGRYSADGGYFASAGVESGPLTALANGEDGGNGVYRYGSSGFPNQTWNSTNYWVDVVFQP